MNLKGKKMNRTAEQKAPNVIFKDLQYQVEVGKGKWTVCVNYKDIKQLRPESESHRKTFYSFFITYIREHVIEIILS